jgi:hypothetical protein
MSELILQPTAAAEWQSLVQEAEKRGNFTLSEDLESYLTFLLMRFTQKPEMAKSVLALEFLNGLEETGYQRMEKLRDVGDKCLLVSGLFPGRAEKRRVRISYFVELGQNAYATLGQSQQKYARLYVLLQESFIVLMDTLHVIRGLSGGDQCLTPLQAQELWVDTASPHARAILKKYSEEMSFHHSGIQ